MIKKIGFAIVCLAAIGLNAQNGTVSPYSFFGIGDYRSEATVENQMMGGIGMYADSIHVNLQNPSAYSKLRLTAYSGGLSHQRFTLNSATEEANNTLTNLDYIALGFNVGKGVGVGFGIKPFSSVGYNIAAEDLNANGSRVGNTFTGSGGLNQVYLSAGYQITETLSIGVTGNFNFGSLENQRTQTVENVQFATFDNRSSRINGMDFNYALNFTPKINEKHTLFTSVRVNTQGNLSSRNTQQIGSFSLATNQAIEEIDVNLDAQGLKNTSIKIPTRTTLGLGYGQDKKWFLGAEYSFQGLSSFENAFAEVSNLRYEDASSIAIGGFFIPDYSSFGEYMKKITYRAGVRMDNTGMLVNNTEINNFGITFGVGLPLSPAAGGFSNVNLGFELGRRGTTDMMLIEENYLKINIGLSLNDRWFIKRRIN